MLLPTDCDVPGDPNANPDEEYRDSDDVPKSAGEVPTGGE